MSEEKAAPAPLNDYYTDDEQRDVIMNLSENLARTRHEDYDAVVRDFNYSDEQVEDYLSGKVDPAERAYQIAKEASRLSAEDIFDRNAESAEPDPNSLDAIFDGK